MKIAELFVALGFKLEGRAKLEELEKSLTAAAVTAGKAALGVGAVTTALGVMLNLSLDGAVALKKFALATGLSTDELQRWMFMAEQNNVSGQAMLETIKAVQKAGADIRIGRGNIAPWRLFGVDPTNPNTFEVIKKLREAINQFPEALARTIAADAGISDDVFQMLRNTNLAFDQLEKQFIASQEQAKALAEIKGQWQGIKQELMGVGIQLASAMLPLLKQVVPLIQEGAKRLAEFVKFLNSGTPEAERWKMILEGILIAIVTISVALAALTAGIGALVAVFAGLEFAPLLADLALVATAIGGIVFLLNDLSKAAAGLPSMFDWKLAIAGGNLMAGAIQMIIAAVDLLRGRWKDALDDFRTGIEDYKEGLYADGFKRFMIRTAAGILLPRSSGGGQTVHNENKNNIYIDGAQSPQATGRAVRDALKSVYLETAGQTGRYSNGY